MGQLKVLVIAADGFIGSYLKHYLEDRYEVIAIHKQDQIDFTLQSSVNTLLDTVKPNVVVNCLTYGFKHTAEQDHGAEVAKNLAMFYNFYSLQDKFDQYINIGSGAEFDRTTNIENKSEREIWQVMPMDSYGFAKNTIARTICNQERFTTLRLFGCFGSQEWSTRFFKRFLMTDGIYEIKDNRYFDYISIQDFASIVNYIIENRILKDDINCVYEHKHRLDELLKVFCTVNNLPKRYTVINFTDYNYTGSSSRLNLYHKVNLAGLESGMQTYLRALQ